MRYRACHTNVSWTGSGIELKDFGIRFKPMVQSCIPKRHQRFSGDDDLTALFNNDNCGHSTAFITIYGGNLPEPDLNKR